LTSSSIYVLPYNVQPDHVLGLLEVIYSLGDSVDPMYVGDFLGEKVDMLPHIIDVASSLGLIEVSGNGNISLTRLGVEVVRGHTQHVRSELKKVIGRIEPFKTIVNTLKEKKRLTVEEFMNILTRFYTRNTLEASRTVLQWGAFLRLFKMDPSDRFILPIGRV